MAYRVHSVTIQKEDQEKADAILDKHWLMGEIDTITTGEKQNSEGIDLVEYWISPYICEDLGVIENEFKQEGIRIF